MASLMTTVFITKIPLLNSVVIKQKGGHVFIAAQDSFIIDKIGLLSLIEELVDIDFIDKVDLEDMVELITRKELWNAKNKENSSNTDSR